MPKCKETKPASEYNKSKRYKDGLSTYCTLCQRLYQREHYRKNKPYYKAKAACRRKRLAKKIADYKEQRPCKDCNQFFLFL